MSRTDGLPQRWTHDALGNLVDRSIGKTPKRSNPAYWNGDQKWATISDMVFGEETLDTKESITEIAVKETNSRLVKKGTLLFSFKLTIGKMAFAGCDLCTNEAIAALVPKDGRIDKHFLFYALQVADLFANVGEASKGRTLNSKTLPLIEVPFPTDLCEQRRIVARIEALTQRAETARCLTLEREDELDTLLKAAYSKMIKIAEWKPLDEVASLVRRKIDTQPDKEYEEMGVRSFGKGTFKKPALTGLQLGSKRIYYIHEGDLVFNNVFSWEGAIAVAQPEDHGRVGSHRFITYTPFDGEATSEFLCHHFLSHRGLEDIGAASPGSAGRNRTLGLKKLEKINVPMPDYKEQLLFQEIAKRRREVRKEAVKAQKALTAYRVSVIAKAFRGEL